MSTLEQDEFPASESQYIHDAVAKPHRVERSQAVRQLFDSWFTGGRRTIWAVGMIASAGLLDTILGVVGALVQAHFISPTDLGFIRKYSVIAGYATFLNLGLFTILQRDYPVLIGQGQQERARRTAAIIQTWILLSSALVCGALAVVTAVELLLGHWREAAAWFIQIIAVWASLYLGYLSCTYRSGQEFQRWAKGQMLSSILSVVVIPLFPLWPFPTLVLRSVLGSIISSIYLHVVRPVKVGWSVAWRELASLIKRGMRLYVSDYLRYVFWLTVEIALVYRFAGNAGVGIFVFSRMIAEAVTQLASSVNHVYLPRLAQRYGETASVRACIEMSARPTLLNLAMSFLAILGCWYLLPPVILFAFPQYAASIPVTRVLVFQLVLTSISLPLYLVTLTESYLLQLFAALAGLGLFVGMAFLLRVGGSGVQAVAWATLSGQAGFTVICLIGLLVVATDTRRGRLPHA